MKKPHNLEMMIRLLKDEGKNTVGLKAVLLASAHMNTRVFCDYFVYNFKNGRIFLDIRGDSLYFVQNENKTQWCIPLSLRETEELGKLFQDGRAYPAENYYAAKTNDPSPGFAVISPGYMERQLAKLKEVF